MASGQGVRPPGTRQLLGRRQTLPEGGLGCAAHLHGNRCRLETLGWRVTRSPCQHAWESGARLPRVTEAPWPWQSRPRSASFGTLSTATITRPSLSCGSGGASHSRQPLGIPGENVSCPRTINPLQI